MVDYNKLFIGNANVKLIYAGQDHVKRIYKGDELIYIYGWNPITFYPTGNMQTFTVPLGTTRVHIDCVGAKGQGNNAGKGGRVECDLKVTAGDTLYIMVGAQASAGISAPTYNASDIRIGGTALTDRVIVAGGGGNQANSGASGGAGGGLVGGNGSSNGEGYAGSGLGGTQTEGGAGGTGWSGGQGHHHNGGQGQFGLGGDGSYETVREGPSGAGGAGWYGGGGGAGSYNKAGSFTAGGGGGSSYTNENCLNVVHTQGYQDSAGYVRISYVEV